MFYLLALTHDLHGTTGLARIATYRSWISRVTHHMVTSDLDTDATLLASERILYLHRAIELDPACKGR